MKIASTIAGILLGLLFLMASVPILFHLIAMPVPKDDGSPAYHFSVAFAASGYVMFVKFFEMAGAILVAIPRTRNFGLLVLGPIIINILAFHVLFTGGHGLEDPMVIGIVVLAAFLLWVERRAFLGLLRR